ncbi:MAG: uracil-DNA glycosylase [Pirellulales bacterium]
MHKKWDRLNRRIVRCAACPRLIAHCQATASQKRRAFLDWDYWGRPVPNFGNPDGRLLIVGLAPAAHGANRTGRMFTGDRSGNWLYRALHRAGFASQANSDSLEDGMKLNDCVITAVCHCAPPENKPAIDEVANCRTWFDDTISLCTPQVYLALGQISWKAIVKYAAEQSWYEGRQPKFAHGACVKLLNGSTLIGSYHPSQQNTFTGRLTEPMLDEVFRKIKRLLA